jgi:hypothetical protein
MFGSRENPKPENATESPPSSAAVVGGVFIEHNQTFKPLASKAYIFAVRHNIWCICPS